MARGRERPPRHLRDCEVTEARDALEQALTTDVQYVERDRHSAAARANTTRFLYLDPAAPEFFVDWDRVANDAAAMLRLEAGRNPHDRKLVELVGELSTRSEIFRKRWASHDVQYHRSGQKRLRHPVMGQLDLNFESMELSSEPGLTLTIYTATPGTPRGRPQDARQLGRHTGPRRGTTSQRPSLTRCRRSRPRDGTAGDAGQHPVRHRHTGGTFVTTQYVRTGGTTPIMCCAGW
jgi:hypothetical protein